MTEQEIERFKQFQEIDKERVQLESFLISITENEEKRLRFANINVMMYDADGINHDINRYPVPEQLNHEIYEVIIGIVKHQIEELNDKIKAL